MGPQASAVVPAAAAPSPDGNEPLQSSNSLILLSKLGNIWKPSLPISALRNLVAAFSRVFGSPSFGNTLNSRNNAYARAHVLSPNLLVLTAA